MLIVDFRYCRIVSIKKQFRETISINTTTELNPWFPANQKNKGGQKPTALYQL
jgi:hypothetical protein